MAKKRSKNLKQIEEALPNLANNEDIVAAADALDEYEDVEAFTKHPGGRVMIEKRLQRAGIMFSEILALTKKEHTHLQLLSMLTRLESEIDLISSLKHAAFNAEEQRKIVDALIQEAL